MNFPVPVIVLFVIGVMSIGAVTCQGQDPQEATDVPATKAKIESILVTQAKAWNEGNLEKFMETYWNSDKLTFSGGGKTTYGWQGTLDKYRKSYAPPKQMGRLHFDELDIMMIESNSALVLGNWHLKMKGDEKRDGNFSLVVKKLDSGWKIIHDHSSTLEPADVTEKNE